jgi:chromosome segregation ATPase
LENIVEQFNIQVENPVCFLNQETSKHFLNSSNTGDKYKLFMKASQLEAMHNLQEQIASVTNSSRKLIEEKESFLPMLESDLFKAEDLYKKCQSVDKLRDKQRRLMNEHVWAVVIEAERDLELIQREKNKIVKSKEKIVEKMEESRAAHHTCLPEFERAKKNVSEKTRELDEITSTGNKVDAEFKQVQALYRNTQSEIKKHEQQIEKKKRQKADLEKKLVEEKKNTQVDYEEEKRARDTRVNELKAKIKETLDMERFKTQEAGGYKSTMDQNARKIGEMKDNISDNERLVNNLRSDIDKFAKAKNDQLVRFGEFMPALVGEVKRMTDSGKFKQQPLGPVGMFLQPREDKWALAIEQCLGPLLVSFVCGNYDDERLMHQIIAKHVTVIHKRPRVIVTDFNSGLYDAARFVSFILICVNW